ncbi:alcohol dehydrogenase [Penicillium verhagenii]|uniref:alcohol dehydrogenase n=1 Tax=Penicillium verhagenii TaxID=1562060 RepID=UPI002545B573|nr:alcohol dehydrogenase [Penicillium verhagenii]KAJ5934792.1 alcohol dehydrogenase [Penicillium verhagenii]
MSITQTAQWTVIPNGGWEGLNCTSAPINNIGPNDCLIQIQAVSLNYRDVAIPMGAYPMTSNSGIIPCSDAAGIVLAIGNSTTRFKAGDHVCTAFNPAHQSGLTSLEKRKYSLGNVADGTLRQYAVFHEAGLVLAPRGLNMVEASTLSCAGVTAWNCLFGLKDRALGPGDWVLTQGTGGVSLFAIQIALAAGSTVVATTSSEEKAGKLRAMGVQHVINYVQDRDWGETAKRLSPGGEGVHHVIEVGGEGTMPQSLRAVRMEGVISLVGFLSGAGTERKCGFLDCLQTMAIVRGITVGPVDQFEALNAFIAEHGIKPVVDQKMFSFDEAKDAFQYLWEKKNYGKVVICT